MIVFIPGWLCYLDALRSSVPGMKSLQVFLGEFFPLIPFVIMAFLVQFLLYHSDGACLGTRWRGSDLCRLALWSTASFTLPLFLLALAIEFIRDRLVFVFSLAAFSGVLSLVATSKLRRAEGIRPRAVKSGEFHKRALALARKMGVHLDRISVIPYGRGRLSNAYGGWRGVAITEDYNEWLRGSQLDFVVAHELAHVRHQHGLKALFVVAGGFTLCICGLGLLHSRSLIWTVLARVTIVLVPLFFFYFVSRLFEYAADEEATSVVGDPEIGTAALSRLYQHVHFPQTASFVEECFATHPSLRRRTAKIGRFK